MDETLTALIEHMIEVASGHEERARKAALEIVLMVDAGRPELEARVRKEAIYHAGQATGLFRAVNALRQYNRGTGIERVLEELTN